MKHKQNNYLVMCKNDGWQLQLGHEKLCRKLKKNSQNHKIRTRNRDESYPTVGKILSTLPPTFPRETSSDTCKCVLTARKEKE